MKFTCTIEIARPHAWVAALFADPDNRKKWQPGYISHSLISGNPGEVGTKTNLRFESKQGEMELIETILTHDLPHEISGLYEHEHMVNTMKNRFKELEPGKTLYEAEVEYTEFRGILPRLMSLVFPKAFRQQVDLHLKAFKTFAEGISPGS